MQGAKNLDLTVCPGFDFRELLFRLLPLDANLSELLVAEREQSLTVQLFAFCGNHIPGLIRHLFNGGLPGQDIDNTLAVLFLKNPNFVFQVLPQTLDFLLLDLQGPCIFVNTLTSEDLDVDHRALNAGGCIERCILHLSRFLAEDGPQQLFFRCQLCFTLGHDLSNQKTARTDLGTDADDSTFIQIG